MADATRLPGLYLPGRGELLPAACTLSVRHRSGHDNQETRLQLQQRAIHVLKFQNMHGLHTCRCELDASRYETLAQQPGGIPPGSAMRCNLCRKLCCG